jgi:hypothetical protein
VLTPNGSREPDERLPMEVTDMLVMEQTANVKAQGQVRAL